MKYSCDFNIKDENGQSPLHLAAQLNNYAGAFNLLSIFSVDKNVNTIFFNLIF